jgi:hypothetical protein
MLEIEGFSRRFRRISNLYAKSAEKLLGIRSMKKFWLEIKNIRRKYNHNGSLLFETLLLYILIFTSAIFCLLLVYWSIILNF